MYPFSTKEIMACNVAENPASLCSSPCLKQVKENTYITILYISYTIIVHFTLLLPTGLKTYLEYIGFPELLSMKKCFFLFLHDMEASSCTSIVNQIAVTLENNYVNRHLIIVICMDELFTETKDTGCQGQFQSTSQIIDD